MPACQPGGGLQPCAGVAAARGDVRPSVLPGIQAARDREWCIPLTARKTCGAMVRPLVTWARVVYEALTGRALVVDKSDTRNYLRYKGSCFSHRVHFLTTQWWGVLEVLLAASGPEQGLPLANPFQWAEELCLFTQ